MTPKPGGRTIPDPYAPAGPPRTAVSEVRSPAEQFATRLRDLGATDDEVQAVVDSWDDLDPDDSTDPEAWTRARRDQVAVAPDAELAAMIDAARDEYEVGTTTEEEAANRAHMVAYQAAYTEAQGRIGGNVDSVLAWVGDDPVRAEAVLELEQRPEGAQRKTLVAPLLALVDADGTDTPDGPPDASTGHTGAV